MQKKNYNKILFFVELERAMRKITNEYQRFVAQKKGVGEVKKQLYNIPTYVEDRQRRGVHLPRNLVSTPIACKYNLHTSIT